MVAVLACLVLAFCTLSVLALMRLGTRKHPSETSSILVLIYCCWIFSTVVWSTLYASFPIPGLFDISIDRFFFILLIILSTFKVLFKQVNIRANYSIEIVILLFSLTCIASMGIHGFDSVNPIYPKPFYIFLFGYLAPFFAFLFVKYFVTNEANFRLILSTLFILGIYLCITGIFERNNLKEFVFPHYITLEQYTLHLDRARGPFLNSAFNGVGMTLGFIAGVLLLHKTQGFKRLGIIILLLPSFPGIFYTHTRSIYLIFLFSLVTIFFFFRSNSSKWKIIPIVICVCFFFVAANFQKIFSQDREGGGIAQMEEVAIRFALIERSGRLFSENPLLGVGLAQFSSTESSPEIFQEQQHNHLLGIAVELGLIGFLLYVLIIFIIYFRLYSLASNPTNDTNTATNFIISMTLLYSINLINNCFVEPSYCPFINIISFSFAGFIDRLYQSPELILSISNTHQLRSS